MPADNRENTGAINTGRTDRIKSAASTEMSFCTLVIVLCVFANDLFGRFIPLGGIALAGLSAWALAFAVIMLLTAGEERPSVPAGKPAQGDGENRS